MVSETHLIQLIFKYKYVENIREIGKGYKDKLFLSGQWRSACEKDEMTSFQVIPLSLSILIFFLFFFSWLFCLFDWFFNLFCFFQNASKNQWEGLVEKTCFIFFWRLFLTREERTTAFMMTFSSTPSPAILLLPIDSSQQCIPKSSSCQNANKQILIQQRIITHMYCQILTIPFVQLELQKNTPVQIWSHYTVQSPSATWHSYGKVWLPFAGLCQSSWEYCLSHSKEAAEIELLQGGWLAVILKLDNVLLWNLCITYTIIFVTII